jgi:hypothetical protein
MHPSSTIRTHVGLRRGGIRLANVWGPVHHVGDLQGPKSKGKGEEEETAEYLSCVAVVHIYLRIILPGIEGITILRPSSTGFGMLQITLSPATLASHLPQPHFVPLLYAVRLRYLTAMTSSPSYPGPCRFSSILYLQKLYR